MHKLSTQLTCISDPGHGWLEVPLTDIATLGIEGEISPYSFINENAAYLEEDCDYACYMEARQAQGHAPPEIRQQYMHYFNRANPALATHSSRPHFGRDCGGERCLT
ncbi:MAG: hypothetical protein R3E31_02575 [Chloroflexota bacterium]